ncbi:LytTR family DNA-binding domain-containing protein [Winogradskyella helgolandensis]|uniref:LytTR family DNA-binding domain-containing protein n=1 Tax=Winogradskyella helgolandensis TaxID=2697010 RepID=UPI0015B9F2F4|nr:LytTR family DNA-binding domain-containing protein [Winogradskyella helgolandensis]
MKYPFDPLIKHHVIISLLLAIWVFVFLYFTEPLDVNQLSTNEKLIYLPGYGLVAGFCYLLFLPFQTYLYQRLKKQWMVLSELVFILTFSIVSILIARCYYLYIVVANEPNPYTLGYMLTAILLPAVATILPIILIGRFSFGKYYEKQLDDQKIEIKGEGNYEGLRLQLNDLICVQSSDNYIEVFYLSGPSLKKTLIRNKLSVISDEFPKLLRAHRSYLINPFHFQRWKTENGKLFVILNHHVEVPISKTYKDHIKTAINSTTN